MYTAGPSWEGALWRRASLAAIDGASASLDPLSTSQRKVGEETHRRNSGRIIRGPELWEEGETDAVVPGAVTHSHGSLGGS